MVIFSTLGVILLRSVSWENLVDPNVVCSYGFFFHFEKIINHLKRTGPSKRSCIWYHWVIQCSLPAAWTNCGNGTWKLVMCLRRLLLSMTACLSSYALSCARLGSCIKMHVILGCALMVVFLVVYLFILIGKINFLHYKYIKWNQDKTVVLFSLF